MVRKFARAGIVTLFVAGAGLASLVPASAAQVRPGVGQGTEVVWTYYNNAAHQTVVGEHAVGSCGLVNTGTTTAYYTVNEYLCP